MGWHVRAHHQERIGINIHQGINSLEISKLLFSRVDEIPSATMRKVTASVNDTRARRRLYAEKSRQKRIEAELAWSKRISELLESNRELKDKTQQLMNDKNKLIEFIQTYMADTNMGEMCTEDDSEIMSVDCDHSYESLPLETVEEFLSALDDPGLSFSVEQSDVAELLDFIDLSDLPLFVDSF